MGLAVSREEIDFFDDVQEGFGALGFIGDSFGRFVRSTNETLVVGGADDEKERVKFFLWIEVELVDKRAELFEGIFFD